MRLLLDSKLPSGDRRRCAPAVARVNHWLEQWSDLMPTAFGQESVTVTVGTGGEQPLRDSVLRIPAEIARGPAELLPERLMAMVMAQLGADARADGSWPRPASAKLPEGVDVEIGDIDDDEMFLDVRTPASGYSLLSYLGVADRISELLEEVTSDVDMSMCTERIRYTIVLSDEDVD